MILKKCSAIVLNLFLWNFNWLKFLIFRFLMIQTLSIFSHRFSKMRWLATLVVPIFLLSASLVDTTPSTTKLPYVQCKRTYRKIGCFDMKKSPAQTYLINDRDPKSQYFQGHELSWEEFEESIHRLVVWKKIYFLF